MQICVVSLLVWVDASSLISFSCVHRATAVIMSSVLVSDESAAQLTPKELGQVNKELSSLQPVVDALRILSEQRQEVRHGFPAVFFAVCLM